MGSEQFQKIRLQFRIEFVDFEFIASFEKKDAKIRKFYFLFSKILLKLEVDFSNLFRSKLQNCNLFANLQ